MILVTGASGTVGGAVAAELAGSKVPFRALYRSQADAPAARGIDVVIADFADKPSLDRALQNIDTVFLVCSPVRELVELESNMIEAAERAGVERVVLNSALGAGDYSKSFPSWHRKVEDKLKASGLEYTILRPNSFMQNVLAYYAPTIRTQGAFYAAMGNARVSYIDVRDVAAVAARALTSREHVGETYELNGPEAVTYSELARRISRAAGREVQYADLLVEQQRQAMLSQHMPEWQVTALLDLQAYYTGGQGGDADRVIQRIIGRPPRGLDDFLAEFADRFRAGSGQT